MSLTKSEHLLRERLRPCQVADLRKNGGFNVRGSNGLCYRIGVNDDPNQNDCRIIDQFGRRRGFWVYEIAKPGHSVATNLIRDRFQHALALLLLLQAYAADVERTACVVCQTGMAPGSYGGEI